MYYGLYIISVSDLLRQGDFLEIIINKENMSGSFHEYFEEL